MQETTMEDPKTPIKPQQSLKCYVRRKPNKVSNKPQDTDPKLVNSASDSNIGNISSEELQERLFSHGESEIPEEAENKKQKEELGNKCDKSKISQGKVKRKNSNEIPKKQRSKIMEDKKKPRNEKKRKNEKDNEEETILACRTPEKESSSKRSKIKAKRNLAPTLTLIKDKSHEKNNKLLCLADETIMTSSSSVAPKQRNKRTKDTDKNLIQQLSYRKEHHLSSLADVPLHIEDTLMTSDSDSDDIKEKLKAKVNLDSETIKEWELLMESDLSDEERDSKWKGKREILESMINLFISRMHLLQGNRKFKQWKGSVVDSVVGVFLTQNVSDLRSSNAFMSVAAKFPVDTKENLESLAYYIEEPPEVNDLVADKPDDDVDDVDDVEEPEEEEPEEPVEEPEKVAKRKNKKTGIMEDEKVDWKSLRKMFTKEGGRDMMHKDIVDWNAVRLSHQEVLANIIIERGTQNKLASFILKFLEDEQQNNGTVDLEWLRNAPYHIVKRHLQEIKGIGLKSSECIRLLALKHSAFPVDTNVGRIAVRLGWVPLKPLLNDAQMHQITDYPSENSIQKYLWPRLCKLSQETLYELHYQTITFGKVFCTKEFPNCNACPMKSECKYFASAYSSKVLLEACPKGKTEESKSKSDTESYTESYSTPSYSHDVDANITAKINWIKECVSEEYSNPINSCEPVLQFPSSPSTEILELIDIEDTPCRSPCRSYDYHYQSYDEIHIDEVPEIGVPEIGVDIDALKKNVVDALRKSGRILDSSSDEVSQTLVLLTPENACIPIELPHETIYYDRLRTEHLVYVLPDNHPLLNGFERRDPNDDDPVPYLLAKWQPGETPNSSSPPMKRCKSQGSDLCKFKSCSSCWTKRENTKDIYRGTILIPCRTATRGSFPLNGTYFQTNEVFADYETSLRPLVFPREWVHGLEQRILYCGSSVTSIFKLLDGRKIQLCFWTGFTCMRAFDRKKRKPKGLVRRLHTAADNRGK